MHLLKQRRVVILFSATLALGLSMLAANAQSQSATPEKTDAPQPADQGWHVGVAPYLWFAGINGTVGALDHEASVHVSASKVLSYFNFGLMGAVETRYNRIIIPVDFMWVKLKDDKGIPITDDFESVHVKINEFIFTPKVGYRIVDNSRFKNRCLVWAALLARWNDLNPAADTSQQWFLWSGEFGRCRGGRQIPSVPDPEGYTHDRRRLDYQVVGLIGYKLKRVTLEGGWRYLVIHKNHTGESFIDLAMTGVVLGVVTKAGAKNAQKAFSSVKRLKEV